MKIVSTTGSEVCTTDVRPHCLNPVVELCSAKISVCELYKGGITWLLQLKMLQDNVVDAASASSSQKRAN